MSEDAGVVSTIPNEGSGQITLASAPDAPLPVLLSPQQKAEALLIRLLSPKQREQWQKYKAFCVKFTGTARYNLSPEVAAHRYIVALSSPMGVWQLDADAFAHGLHKRHLWPKGFMDLWGNRAGYPEMDVMIFHKIGLETAGPDYVQYGCIHSWIEPPMQWEEP